MFSAFSLQEVSTNERCSHQAIGNKDGHPVGLLIDSHTTISASYHKLDQFAQQLSFLKHRNHQLEESQLFSFHHTKVYVGTAVHAVCHVIKVNEFAYFLSVKPRNACETRQRINKKLLCRLGRQANSEILGFKSHCTT